ncbi:sensor histidine kinase [Agrobacterium vitis]|uniref:Oxygen sensor histidine kinase NreB n=1 Tax=Agrobacterium vitis TaxID=373 RepID=A0AAE4WA86_AGRVI|nr:sensor histidine kinase [Agrobacterium vitis]MCF1497328.1 sensor histidine kinase [Allorhizobium sp. Av2]MCM2438978.1 sensor histidine kinase [Agrobacterium vitis]MUZ56744.1 sensor histidine kinase [Agrobacterium vitis]MVA65104.1 sensor histidine kinase [Agrobacterium vitis]MVA86119.1 sensor histidine kinase [Agrobacterium vitis]
MTTATDPEHLASPIQELRKLYREAEARASRLRLIVETRASLDRYPHARAITEITGLIGSFCGGSTIHLRPPAERHQTIADNAMASMDGRTVITFEDRSIASISDEDKTSLQIVADLLAAAIFADEREQEREALLLVLAEREKQLAQLLAAILSTQERERSHIAYDLHDGVAQTLVSLLHHLQALEADPALTVALAKKVDQCSEIARLAIQDIRHAIADLRPAELDDLGLPAAIGAKLDTVDEIACRLDNRLPDGRLPQAIEIVLYRVAQEAITNARKHAGGQNLHVQLRIDAGHVVLEASDDGCGFSLSAGQGENKPVRGFGIGLSAMQERLSLVNGTLDIISAPHQGTRLIARVPLTEKDQSQ